MGPGARGAVMTLCAVAMGAAPGWAQTGDAGAGEDQPAQVAQVAWLAGCWEAATGSRRTREVWMAPDGGLMVGMSRSVRDGRATGWEFLLLGESGGTLVYRAHPSGQQPTDFKAVQVSDDQLVVSNPEHDFPRRITYRKVSADSLAAEVYGEAEGGDPAFVVRYARAGCTPEEGL